MTTALEIEKLLDDYRVWLKDKTTLREVNSKWVEITTPYLDRHNDAPKTAGTFSPMTAIQFTISKRLGAVSVRKSDKTS